VDTLITYLPFYRVHEVVDYFMVNARLLGVRRRLVYVDNVFKDRQLELLRRIIPEEVEVRYGNWRDRNLTFMRIVRDAREEGLDALVVDSDNLLEPELASADGELVSRYGYYTVLDHETRVGPSSLRGALNWVRLRLMVSRLRFTATGYRACGRGSSSLALSRRLG